MKSTNYKSRTLNNHLLKPETLMMGYGYAPGLSEGALKPPIFLTSTFVFESAQQGKDFFDLSAGRRKPRPARSRGWSIPASTTPISRSWRIAWRSGTTPSAPRSSPAAWLRSRR